MRGYSRRLRDYIKKHGIKNTIKRIVEKLLNKLFKSSSQRKFEKEEKENYLKWIENNEPNEEELEIQKKHKFEYEPKISIIVPMYNTKERYFKELVESIQNQTYSNWELCLSDGSKEKAEFVEEIIKENEKIKYKFLNENKGISENSNEALKLATGDYYALLDHDDILPKFSLYEIVKKINEDKYAEFIYTDEDKVMEYKENRLGPHFKPDYAPDTLCSYNYICHFSIFKKSLMERLKGFNKEFDGSQDYDLILRATEEANRIIHIPKILYHWRMNENSVALSADAKPYAYEAAKKVLRAHFKRMKIDAIIEDSVVKGLYRVKYKVNGNPKVSIIIPNKDHVSDLRNCLLSLKNTEYENYEVIIVENNSQKEETFKYYEYLEKEENIKVVKYEESGFNYSKINNFGTKYIDEKSEYIVFLNNDIEIYNTEWLGEMLGTCQREDVGIVGAKLMYPNNTVQHSGVVLNFTGVAGHVNLNEDANEAGYMGRIMIQQNFSAVTGAMMMISRNDFESVKGFDEDLPVAYNDIDLCLKIRNKGKLVVYNPYAIAYHYESKSRGYEVTEEKKKRLENDAKKLKEKWPEFFEKPDPYFNINFRHDAPNMRVNPNKID